MDLLLTLPEGSTLAIEVKRGLNAQEWAAALVRRRFEGWNTCAGT